MSKPCRCLRLAQKCGLLSALASSVLCLSAAHAAAQVPATTTAATPAAASPAAASPAAASSAGASPAAASSAAASPAAASPAGAPSASLPVERAPVAPERTAVALSLFQQGMLHWENRRYAEAVPLFSASYDQNPLSSPLLLLADCYEQLGQLRTARATFQRAAAAASQYGEADIASRAETRAAALDPRVPQLELRVPRPLPAGLVVTLNGREVQHIWLNRPMPMDAGAYRVEAQAPGYDPVSMPFHVSNELPLGQPLEVVPVPLRPRPETFERRELALWLGGAGAAVGLAGLVVAGVALYKDNGTDPEDKEDARWLAKWLGTGSALISIPALGSAALLYYTAPEQKERSALGLRWSGAF